MKRTYKLCVDAECKTVKELSRENLENFMERLAWIS